MFVDKNQLIELITENVPDNSAIDVTLSVSRPISDNTLIGAPYGSVSNILSRSSVEFAGEIVIQYRYNAAI